MPSKDPIKEIGLPMTRDNVILNVLLRNNALHSAEVPQHSPFTLTNDMTFDFDTQVNYLGVSLKVVRPNMVHYIGVGYHSPALNSFVGYPELISPDEADFLTEEISDLRQPQAEKLATVLQPGVPTRNYDHPRVAYLFAKHNEILTSSGVATRVAERHNITNGDYPAVQIYPDEATTVFVCFVPAQNGGSICVKYLGARDGYGTRKLFSTVEALQRTKYEGGLIDDVRVLHTTTPHDVQVVAELFKELEGVKDTELPLLNLEDVAVEVPRPFK